MSVLNKASSIVVLDDELAVAELTAVILRELGFENIKVFSSSHSFIAHARETSFELCFMDIRLSDTDGLVLLGWLKLLHRDTRVVMFSGNTQRELVTEASILGAEGFLSKVDLDRNIRQLLNKWHVNYPLA